MHAGPGACRTAAHATLSGVGFCQVTLSGARRNDSNLTGWPVKDTNLSVAVMGNLNPPGAALIGCLVSGSPTLPRRT